ncbi:MAG: hypothetical protein H7Y10_00740 [Flavobacterium sp.]|nr:hypothetical protein [Flavobacterium sp.]
MMKNYLLFSFLVTSCKLIFQEVCFLAVNNFRKLTFKISDQTIAAQLQRTTGTSYGMRYSILFNITKK